VSSTPPTHLARGLAENEWDSVKTPRATSAIAETVEVEDWIAKLCLYIRLRQRGLLRGFLMADVEKLNPAVVVLST
jgi:hypothetical protein